MRMISKTYATAQGGGNIYFCAPGGRAGTSLALKENRHLREGASGGLQPRPTVLYIPPMQIDEYIEDKGITRRELASRLETTEQHLSALSHGSKKWGIELIARMIRATDGAVGILDLRPDLFPPGTPRSLFARGGRRDGKESTRPAPS